jgi:membrane protein YdbS with pleckstrin-like domain
MRRYYTYVLEDQVFELKQGIINKQHRTLPYGVIQNVFVQQGFIDRMFGLANVVIENTAAGTGGQAQKSFWTLRTRNNTSAPGGTLGFSAGRISIPGLSKENAGKLKTYVLQKMKENPINDRQSGL